MQPHASSFRVDGHGGCFHPPPDSAGAEDEHTVETRAGQWVPATLSAAFGIDGAIHKVSRSIERLSEFAHTEPCFGRARPKTLTPSSGLVSLDRHRRGSDGWLLLEPHAQGVARQGDSSPFRERTDDRAEPLGNGHDVLRFGRI